MLNKKKQGKKNRASGKRFELKVREDFEKKGWIVSKWCNNLKCVGIDQVMIPAKAQYNPFFKRIVGEGSGFPDFIVYRFIQKRAIENPIEFQSVYQIIGVECKFNGYLDKEEKFKCEWLLENNIFSKILIGKRGKKRGEIIYENYLERKHI